VQCSPSDRCRPAYPSYAVRSPKITTFELVFLTTSLTYQMGLLKLAHLPGSVP
jgi:hypothetical protein